jgi:hypothetical protein
MTTNFDPPPQGSPDKLKTLLGGAGAIVGLAGTAAALATLTDDQLIRVGIFTAAVIVAAIFVYGIVVHRWTIIWAMTGVLVVTIAIAWTMRELASQASSDPSTLPRPSTSGSLAPSVSPPGSLVPTVVVEAPLTTAAPRTIPPATPPETASAGGARTGDIVEQWSNGMSAWDNHDPGQITVGAGQLVLTAPAGSTAYFIIELKARRDFRASFVSIEVVSAGDRSTSLNIIPLSAGNPDSNEVRWEISGNQIFARIIRDAKTSEVLPGSAFTAQDYRYLSISENGGIFRWSRSPDGLSWSTYATAAVDGMDMSAVRVRLYGGNYAAEPAATEAIFDSFNCRAPGVNRC